MSFILIGSEFASGVNLVFQCTALTVNGGVSFDKS
jgi:hypothetical protein